jgi:hypothetical protein
MGRGLARCVWCRSIRLLPGPSQDPTTDRLHPSRRRTSSLPTEGRSASSCSYSIASVASTSCDSQPQRKPPCWLYCGWVCPACESCLYEPPGVRSSQGAAQAKWGARAPPPSSPAPTRDAPPPWWGTPRAACLAAPTPPSSSRRRRRCAFHSQNPTASGHSTHNINSSAHSIKLEEQKKTKELRKRHGYNKESTKSVLGSRLPCERLSFQRVSDADGLARAG